MAFLSNISKSGDVAERSPAVISANLKEDMLYQKKLVVLARSERSVVHQVKVDQKVLYKRFQARLIRSKLSQAQLLGNRDLERELRAKTIGGLNTDIAGNSEEDYAFLKMLKQRPCTASSFSPRMTEPIKPKRPTTKEGAVSIRQRPKAAEELPKPQGRSASARARYHRQLAEENDNAVADGATTAEVEPEVKEEIKAQLRPATSSGARIDEEFQQHQEQLKGVPSKTRPKTSEQAIGVRFDVKLERATDESVSDSTTASVADEQTIDNANGKSSESSQDTQENNTKVDVQIKEDNGTEESKDDSKVVAFLDDLKLDIPILDVVINADTLPDDSVPSTPISPSQLSRRQSRGAEFFHEEKKIDLVSLRLRQARAVDFTDDVKQFCDIIDDMNANQPPSVDYYSMRREIAADKSVEKPLAQVPGTPEDENKRSVGNLFVRSLTIPEMDWCSLDDI